MPIYDPETLSQHDGKTGVSVYVAANQKVYDLSTSRLWKAGTHMNRHRAGCDLTAEIAAAPHGPEVLERFPQVGAFQSSQEAPSAPSGAVARLLEQVPFLRRHPHPLVVHFPLAFSNAPVLFFLLFLATGREAFAATTLHCLGAALLFWIPAVLTGYATWWLNYGARPMRAVRIKIACSFLLQAAILAAFLWQLLAPQTVLAPGAGRWLFTLLLFTLVPIVGTIGWFGATLTFPLEKR